MMDNVALESNNTKQKETHIRNMGGPAHTAPQSPSPIERWFAEKKKDRTKIHNA
jgi:hypothetical protein